MVVGCLIKCMTSLAPAHWIGFWYLGLFSSFLVHFEFSYLTVDYYNNLSHYFTFRNLIMLIIVTIHRHHIQTDLWGAHLMWKFQYKICMTERWIFSLHIAQIFESCVQRVFSNKDLLSVLLFNLNCRQSPQLVLGIICTTMTM